MERALRTLTLLLLAVLTARTLHWYPLLPDPFPIHFNGAGDADGWAAKNPVAWALAPGVGIALAAMMGLLAAKLPGMAARSPGSVNMPDKARFLALDEAGRAAALAPTATYLRWVSACVAGLFLYIVEGIGRMATGAWDSLPSWPVLVFMALIIGGLPFLLRATRRALEQAR
jgi:hypothetical protein